MAKQKAIRKVLVTKNTGSLKPPEKSAHARGVQGACLLSSDFKASPACQIAMDAWMAKTDALDKNQQDKKAKQAELDLLIAQEAVCIFEYDEAAGAFASTVQATAKGDAKIVTGMGMAVRAERSQTSEIMMPSGLRISMLTSGAPKLMWDAVAGATLYIAQLSVDPATEASWTALYGGGKSRALKDLIPGQLYVFRVCAVARDGRMTDWSPTVSFIGK